MKRWPMSSSRVSSKPLNRSNQANIVENRQREIESNNYNIIKLRNELQLLRRQASPGCSEGT